MVPGGASILFPDHFDEFINFLPKEERADHIASYHKRLMSDDESISHPAARAWNKWEVSISTLYPNVKGLAQLDDASYNLAHARTEAHYFQNQAWLEEGQLLTKENIDKIRHIPSELFRWDVMFVDANDDRSDYRTRPLRCGLPSYHCLGAAQGIPGI